MGRTHRNLIISLLLAVSLVTVTVVLADFLAISQENSLVNE
jgi:hypothetical protein